MKNVNKNSIDELFKAGLNPERDPVIFGEHEWSELEQRLSRYERNKSSFFRSKSFIGIAALFVLVLSIWMLWPVMQKTLTQQTASQHKEQEVQDGQKQVLSPSLELKKGGETGRELSSLLVSDDPGKAMPGSLGSDIGTRTPSATSAVTDPGTAMTLAETAEETVHKPVLVPDPQLADHQLHEAEMEEDQAKPVPFFAGTEPIHVPEPVRRKWALSLLVAPAYNGVDHLNNGQIGSDIGLMVTLGLTKKWSLSTGAVYAKKLYDADYSYASYTQKVDADCRVLDIPVNVGYTLLNSGKTRISFGTGISSYIMLREDYRFNNSNREDIHLVNENQHWLSVLNLHANYEFKLSPRISINAQPYMKIPVSDIGYYKVRLESLGLAIGAGWSF